MRGCQGTADGTCEEVLLEDNRERRDTKVQVRETEGWKWCYQQEGKLRFGKDGTLIHGFVEFGVLG